MLHVTKHLFSLEVCLSPDILSVEVCVYVLCEATLLPETTLSCAWQDTSDITHLGCG